MGRVIQPACSSAGGACAIQINLECRTFRASLDQRQRAGAFITFTQVEVDARAVARTWLRASAPARRSKGVR